jgi:NAD+ synthase (glutamine-hydrolysing)
MVRRSAQWGTLGEQASRALVDVLETEISPELIPPGAGGEAQRSEDTVGPYPLQDFHLYYLLRFGYRPSKIAFLAWSAWHDAARGSWPDTPEEKRHSYQIAAIKHWLGVLVQRFFGGQQYKRSSLPNSPKVGSGGSLSPRGDYRAPSDSHADAWLAELATVPDEEENEEA